MSLIKLTIQTSTAISEITTNDEAAVNGTIQNLVDGKWTSFSNSSGQVTYINGKHVHRIVAEKM